MAWASFATQGAVEDWHESEEFRQAFQRFHERYALEPRENMMKAMATHRQFMTQIESHFKHLGLCNRLEYTGSVCEGINITTEKKSDDIIEFEVMLIVENFQEKVEISVEKERPGYAKLRLSNGKHPMEELEKVLVEFSGTGRFIDADKTTELFYKELEKCIDESLQMTGRAKLRRQGAEIYMDVYPDSGMLLWGQRLFTVNIIPSYFVNGQLYIAKPIKGGAIPDGVTWRRSTSVEEMRKLVGESKTLVRVLKALRLRDEDLAPLRDVHLRTVVFFEMDANGDWSQSKLAERLIGALFSLECFINGGKLPHYFIPEINLLSSLDQTEIATIRDRLKVIVNNKEEMMKILNS